MDPQIAEIFIDTDDEGDAQAASLSEPTVVVKKEQTKALDTHQSATLVKAEQGEAPGSLPPPVRVKTEQGGSSSKRFKTGVVAVAGLAGSDQSSLLGAVNAKEEAREDRDAAAQPPPAQPMLPTFDGRRTFGALGQAWSEPSLTLDLDQFLSRLPAGVSRETAILRYVLSVPETHGNSQMLEAQVAYLYFAGDLCPLFYDPAFDVWYVWNQYWKTSKNSMTRVRVYFQTSLLNGIRSVVSLARAGNHLPKDQNGEDHYRMTFLLDYIRALTNQQSADKVVRESSMFLLQRCRV